MARLRSWSWTLCSSCHRVKKWGISLRQLRSFYTGMMRGRKSRQMQLVKIRNCSTASLSGCVRAGLSTNKAASPEPWTPYSLTEGRSLQAPGISVSGKPGKCSFCASNTSCWQAYLAPGTEANVLSVLQDSPKWGLSLSCLSREPEEPVVALQCKGMKWPKKWNCLKKSCPSVMPSNMEIISEWIVFHFFFFHNLTIF